VAAPDEGGEALANPHVAIAKHAGRELGARSLEESSVLGDDRPGRRDEAAQRLVGWSLVEQGGVDSGRRSIQRPGHGGVDEMSA